MGEYSQRHLEGSRMNWAMRADGGDGGAREKEKSVGSHGSRDQGAKSPEGKVAKMAEVTQGSKVGDRKPSDFRVEGGICQPGGPCTR